jgi:hypothetical protein
MKAPRDRRQSPSPSLIGAGSTGKSSTNAPIATVDAAGCGEQSWRLCCIAGNARQSCVLFQHLTQEFTIADDWWREADMDEFVPPSPSYPSDSETLRGWTVVQIALDEVEPLDRNLSHGVFNDSTEFGTARSRVVNLLSGMRSGSRIPPVELTQVPDDGLYKYRLKHGAHRFYCSRAAGFTHIPAVVYPPS